MSDVSQIGTGSGLWPVAQALAWPDASFTGLDIVPCQVDLSALAAAADRLSTALVTSPEVEADSLVDWRSVASRIKWDTADW